MHNFRHLRRFFRRKHVGLDILRLVSGNWKKITGFPVGVHARSGTLTVVVKRLFSVDVEYEFMVVALVS